MKEKAILFVVLAFSLVCLFVGVPLMCGAGLLAI